MSGLIWIQTVWHYDGILEWKNSLKIIKFWKKSADNKTASMQSIILDKFLFSTTKHSFYKSDKLSYPIVRWLSRPAG